MISLKAPLLGLLMATLLLANPIEGAPEAPLLREVAPDLTHNSLKVPKDIPPGPVTGEFRILVLFVRFPDDPPTNSTTQLIEQRIQPMADYFYYSSYGNLRLVGQYFLEWVDLPRPLTYYGEDFDEDGDGEVDVDPRIEELVQDTLNIFDPSANYTEYDHLMIIHSAPDQAASDDPGDIWSQCLCDIGAPTGYAFETDDGVIRSNRTGISVVSELEGVGTFIHELGHGLGLPDLYDLKYEAMFVGPWSPMAVGASLGDPPGSGPSDLSAVEKLWLGWVGAEVVRVGSRRNLTLSPLYLGEGLMAVKVPLDQDRYYVFEYRVKAGLDVNLPGGGVLLYLVNETVPSGHGIVRVVDRSPGSLPYPNDLDDAPFRAGDIRAIVTRDFQLGFRVLATTSSSALIEVQNGFPDLVPEGVEVSGRMVAGQELLFTVTIRNLGGVMADPALVEVRLDGAVLGVVETLPIAPGAAYTFDIGPWIASEGTHSLEVRVDVGDRLAGWGDLFEVSEANNRLTRTFLVAPLGEAITTTVTETLTTTATRLVTSTSTLLVTTTLRETATATVTETLTTTISTITTETLSTTITETRTATVTETAIPGTITTTVTQPVTVTATRTTPVTETFTVTVTRTLTQAWGRGASSLLVYAGAGILLGVAIVVLLLSRARS